MPRTLEITDVSHIMNPFLFPHISSENFRNITKNYVNMFLFICLFVLIIIIFFIVVDFVSEHVLRSTFPMHVHLSP